MFSKLSAHKLLIYTITLFVSSPAFGQFSPPGLDEANVAVWSAFGVTQKLSDRWTLSVYAGGSLKSDPDNYSLFRKPGIFVLNEEAVYHICKKWSIGLCVSHRIQYEYESASPFESDTPPNKKEERFYTRIYYRDSLMNLPFVFSVRPELRIYHSDHWSEWTPVDREVRLRFKAQISANLNSSKTNQLIIANEILTATDHEEITNHAFWTGYHFTEDRLSTYLRHKFGKLLIIDVGFMHQIKKDGSYIGHLAFDVILNNPLKRN